MVSIIMGSDSDYGVVKESCKVFEEFAVPFEVKILSAHRTPTLVKEYVIEAAASGTKVFIGAAGKAAHLPGVIASYTVLPVIGLPIKTPDLGGLDSLLSIVQMPPQIPVATVGIDAAKNAALLAIEMLAISSESLQEKLIAFRERVEREIIEKNETFKY